MGEVLTGGSGAVQLSEEEQRLLAERFRRELEEDYHRRLENLATRKERARRNVQRHMRKKYEGQIAELRQQVQESFYREKGYKLHVDSQGRETWMPPEELDWHQKRRKRKIRKRRYRMAMAPQHKMLALYIGIAILAVVLGLIIVH